MSVSSPGKQIDGLWHFPVPVGPTLPACSKTPDAPEQTAAIHWSLHTPFDTYNQWDFKIMPCSIGNRFYVWAVSRWCVSHLVQCFKMASRRCSSPLTLDVLLSQCSPISESWFSRAGQQTDCKRCFPSSSTWWSLCWCSASLPFRLFTKNRQSGKSRTLLMDLHLLRIRVMDPGECSEPFYPPRGAMVAPEWKWWL